jgi:hypothetical protein
MLVVPANAAVLTNQQATELQQERVLHSSQYCGVLFSRLPDCKLTSFDFKPTSFDYKLPSFDYIMQKASINYLKV